MSETPLANVYVSGRFAGSILLRTGASRLSTPATVRLGCLRASGKRQQRCRSLMLQELI